MRHPHTPANRHNVRFRASSRGARPKTGHSPGPDGAWPDGQLQIPAGRSRNRCVTDDDLIAQLRARLAGASATPTAQRQLCEALERYEAEYLQPGLLKSSTLLEYRRTLPHVRARWGHLDLSSTDWRLEAARVVDERGRPCRREIVMLCRVLRLAEQWGWCGPTRATEVLRRIPVRRRRDAWTGEQLAAFLRMLDALDEGHPLRSAVRDVLRVLALTGCRHREVARLTWAEVQGRELRLTDSKTGPRTVWLSDAAAQVVYRQHRVCAWVFPGPSRRGPVTHECVRQAFVEARDRLELPGCVHTLRHTWASLAIRSGVPARYVQEQLGHSAAWMTASYCHASSQDVLGAVEAVAAEVTRG